jgi:hypothetical protein
MHSKLQQEVIDQARVLLSEFDWYKGVHTSEMPTDSEIQRDGIDESVAQVCMESAYWDCPTYPDIQ